LPLTTRPDPVPNNGDRTELVKEFGLARAASVKGRVLGPDGQPVAGAKVRAAGTRPGTSDRTESLEDGTFCLKSVPEGAEVRLIAEKAGLARAILGPFAFSAAEPHSEIVLRLGKGGVVSGRLTDTTGAPITKGRVHLNPQLRMYGGQHSATPDKDGNYRIETVPAGRYSLEVWVQDYVGRKRPDFVVEDGGEYDGIDFVLERGLTITGVVVDQAGNPVEDASIHTTPISPGKDDIPGVRTARTDAEGRFTLTALTSGSHGITIMRQGYAQKNPRAQVRAGEQNVVLEMIKLHEGIVGQVLQQETGTPLTRFFVRWHRGVSAFTRDFTDEEGRFQIKNLIPGAYYLEAGTKEGLVSPQPVRVELIDGTVSVPIQLHVGPGEVITARALSADGTALAQAQIEIVRAVGEPTGVMGRGITDQAGGCRITSIAPGDYVARASHGDWIEVERAFTVRRGRENHVELKLEAKGGTFEVSVKDPRGRPVEGATLRVMRPNGAVMYPDNLKYGRLYQELKKTSPDLDGQVFRARRYRTSADGMVERRFLPAGRLIIEVNKAGYRPGRQEAESLSGVTTRVAITLEPTT
jgi:protocatechuate 3,4-dioxygenase beta subunit